MSQNVEKYIFCSEIKAIMTQKHDIIRLRYEHNAKQCIACKDKQKQSLYFGKSSIMTYQKKTKWYTIK